MTLMDTTVDWSDWAEHAAPLVCPACGVTFRPNHPRRRFCGRDGCPGRTARAAPAPRPPPPRPAPRRDLRRGAENALAGLVAEATLELHRRETAGTANELLIACAALARAARVGCSPAIERTMTVRVLAIASVRSARQAAPRPRSRASRVRPPRPPATAKRILS
jgi:hypothetical protein